MKSNSTYETKAGTKNEGRPGVCVNMMKNLTQIPRITQKQKKYFTSVISIAGRNL